MKKMLMVFALGAALAIGMSGCESMKSMCPCNWGSKDAKCADACACCDKGAACTCAKDAKGGCSCCKDGAACKCERCKKVDAACMKADAAK